MRSPSFLVVFYVLLLLHQGIAEDDPIPIHLVTSDRHYGPDGPWQAVSVSFGNPGQDIDLYPGSGYESIIFTDSLCADVSLEPCGSGGLFHPDLSRSLDNTSIQYSARDEGFDIDWTLGALHITGKSHFAMDSLTVKATADRSKTIPNAATRLVSEASTVYPDGSRFPLQLGQLALGAADVNQSFELGKNIPAINASLISGYLWANKQIPSSSYGLHIGSATLGPPLSLLVGGYDRSRVVGPVSSQSYDGDFRFMIDLLDIAIGVDQGPSPFLYRARENILAENNSSMPNSLSIAINSQGSYLDLPASTCAAIAKDLPVTFDNKYGLYMWNVDDPQYSKIITSPSYLSFIFRASGMSNANLTINVPFQLLNLTLEAPLIQKPTSYFPCSPSQSINKESQYSLGRAFLQAAFFGVDWNQGVGKWFLAQAPGPNTGSSPDIDSYSNSFDEFTGRSDIWSRSWNGYWKPLPETTNASNDSKASATQRIETSNKAFTTTETSSTARATNTAAGGLTTGAKVGLGLGIGIGVAALATIAIAALFFIRRRRRHRVMTPLPALAPEEAKNLRRNQDQDLSLDYLNHEVSHQAPHELEIQDSPAHELYGDGDGAVAIGGRHIDL